MWGSLHTSWPFVSSGGRRISEYMITMPPSSSLYLPEMAGRGSDNARLVLVHATGALGVSHPNGVAPRRPKTGDLPDDLLKEHGLNVSHSVAESVGQQAQPHCNAAFFERLHDPRESPSPFADGTPGGLCICRNLEARFCEEVG